jgi:hypothetical protein
MLLSGSNTMSKSTYIRHANMLKPTELLSTSLCGGCDELFILGLSRYKTGSLTVDHIE